MSQTDRKPHVFIVDDNPIDLSILTNILDENYTVRMAINGQMALATIQKAPPDLILLDILLPDLDGYEVCCQLKANEQTRDIPVIFLSSLSELLDKVKAFNIGGVDYITKPFQTEEVLARVKTHVQLYTQNQRLQQEIAERKQAEVALRENEEKFKAMSTSAQDAMVMMDEHGRISFWNEAAERIFGYSAQEALGQNLHRLLAPPSYLPAHLQAIEQFWKSGQGNAIGKTVELEALRKNGTSFAVELSLSALNLKGKWHAIGILRDITAREQAEKALRKYERMVSATIDHMSLVDRHYTYRVINQAYLLASGRFETDIIGHTVGELHGQDMFDSLIKKYFDSCLAGQVIHYQAWFKFYDLGRRFMDVTYSPYQETDGTISGVVVSSRDITYLKEIEQRLEDIINFLPEATFVIDQYGKVIAWNRAIETMTGIKASDILGKGDYEYALGFYPDKRPILIDLLFLPVSEIEKKYIHIKRQGHTIMAEAHIQNFRGQEMGVYFMAHAAKLFNSKGEVIGAIETVIDITARKLAENALKQVNDENARLLKEEQHQRFMAESLREVATALSRSLDQQTVLAEILGQLGRVIKYDGAAIFLQQKQNLIINDAVGTGKPYIGTAVPLSSSDVAVQVFWQKQPYIIYDTHLDANWANWNPDHSEVTIRSWIGVPLSTNDEVIGILTVDSLTVGTYRAEDIQTIQTFADQASMAIQNAQLFEAIQHERQIADSLREVATILNRSLDQKTVLTEILEQLAWVIQYDGVSVFLQDEDTLVLTDGIGIDENHLGKRILIDGTNPTVAHCFKTNQPLIIADVNEELQWQVWSFGRLIHGWMGAPFLLGQKAIGVLCVESFQIGVYNDESAQILQIFANQAAIAIQNARLFAEVQRANQRFKDELAFAQAIQESLLPPARPNWIDLEVICYNVPAREVGGDFYQYHAFSDFGLGIGDFGLEDKSKIQNPKSKIQKYAFAIGDVSGKGVSAALLMAASLSQLDASLSKDFSPAERLAYLDKTISPYTKPRHQNCAMCYVEIEVRSEEYKESLTPHFLLRTVNAACIPPYIKRQTGEVENPETGGFALGQGFSRLVRYDELELTLYKGDIIILVSDGVIEAKNSAKEMLGFERFKQIVTDGPTTSAAHMMTHLQSQIANFMGNAEPHDDLTIVVVQI